VNPYSIQPRTYDAAALRAWSREIARARDDYLDHPTGRCRKCTRTAEPGTTVCQSCRMSAVRRGKKRKEKK